ncbi:MAG TPA: bacteriohopanetetrol glucosamine biosynthesis glycosyltransferase HpnI [Bryobacteraceae bacterium]|nr:bacteriohopanetetrol glucosamine biosynthesis glycosyltransferase HpnI [Bryobacteraceae bacterium]
MSEFLTITLAVLVAGSLGYCIIVLIGVWSWRRQKPGSAVTTPISVLKPLAGAEPELASNLRSLFEQSYASFEILFAVRDAGDSALPIVEALRAEYPHVPTSVTVTGEAPYPSAKVFSLELMLARANHDLIVMSDSDVAMDPDCLSIIAAEFADQRVGLVTCPYRAVGGPALWERLEQAFSNTEFFGGVMAARLLEGMTFALGPTLAVRRGVFAEVDGIAKMREVHADDFAIGRAVSDAGHRVLLSHAVVEHHLGPQTLSRNASHRLRWARSTRRSRPAGYIGQVFTNPLPLALLLCFVNPTWLPLLGPVLAARAAAAWAVCRHTLAAPVPWLTVPLQDVVSFFFWIAGFFGNTIHWRGRLYRIDARGRIALADVVRK